MRPTTFRAYSKSETSNFAVRPKLKKKIPFVSANQRPLILPSVLYLCVNAWTGGKSWINFTCTSIFTKFAGSRSDLGNLKNLQNTSKINPQWHEGTSRLHAYYNTCWTKFYTNFIIIFHSIGAELGRPGVGSFHVQTTAPKHETNQDAHHNGVVELCRIHLNIKIYFKLPINYIFFGLNATFLHVKIF